MGPSSPILPEPGHAPRAGTVGVEHAGELAGKGPGPDAVGQAATPAGDTGGMGSMGDLRAGIPVVLALAFALGAFCYFTLGFEPDWAWVLAGLGVAAGGWAVLRRPTSVLAPICGGLLLAGMIGFAHAKWVAVTTDTITVAPGLGPLQLEGWVRKVEPGRNGPRLRIAVHAIQGMDSDGTPGLVRVTHPLSLRVGPGRFVRCRAVLRPPPEPAMPGDYDFQRQAYLEGLGAVGYVQGRCRGGPLGSAGGPVAAAGLWLDGKRRRIAEHVRVAAGERAGGFAAALVSGDRSYMPEADQAALRGSGLAHLLAISGLHLSIVCGLVYLLVRRSLALAEPLAVRVAVQKPAALAALLAGGVYLLLSGASVSTQRAFIMAAIFFGAILFDRPGFSLRSFAVAMVAVVLIDPVSVTSPGFQMSFAATGALIATYEALSRRRAARADPAGGSRVAEVVNSLVVTSVVASFATAPFALYHFDRVSGGGLLANLLAMPIISFVSAPAAGLALVLAPLGLDSIGLRLFGLSLEWVLAIAHWANALPGQALVPAWPMPGVSFALLVAALAGWVLLTGWWRWLGLLVPCLLAGFSWVSMKGADLHWGADGHLYVFSADGALRLDLVDGDRLGPLRYSDLEPHPACRTGTCRFPSHRGVVEIRWQREEPVLCLQRGLRASDAGRAVTDCGQVLGWAEVEAAGGVSVHLGRGPAPGGRCRPRPWRPC